MDRHGSARPLKGDLGLKAAPVRGGVAWTPRSAQYCKAAQVDLFDTDGDRTSQHAHAVQDMDGDGNLGVTSLILAKSQRVADHRLVTSDGGLDAATLVVARRLLPADPTSLGNTFEMAVALSGFGLSPRSALPWHVVARSPRRQDRAL